MQMRKQEFDAARSKKSFANRQKPQSRKQAIVEPLEPRTLLTGTLPSAAQFFANNTFGADAADPVRDIAYVVDQTDNKVLAISTDSGITVGVAQLAASASSVCVSIDDTRLFVAEPGAFQVEVFSLPSLQLLKTLNVGVAINQLVPMANDRFLGDNVIFNAETGATLYTESVGYQRGNAAGTELYDRATGLSGNDGSIGVLDVSGTGAPVALPSIPGPVGANSSEFAVDRINGKAYMGDGGHSGVEVTNIASGNMTTWNFTGGGSAEGIAQLPGSQNVYALAWFSNELDEFDQNGNVLNKTSFPVGYTPDTLVITPNSHLFYTFINNIGIVGISSMNVTLTPPQLLFHAVPSQAFLGNIINPPVVVYVVNQNNQIISQDNSNITLSLLGGTLSGTTTVTAVNGVATFSNLKINAVGTYSLYASDGAYNPTVSSSITVSRPQLTFASVPTVVTAGKGIAPSVTVDIEDSQGHLVTSDNSAVTLSAIVGPGSLGGITTVNAVNGVATFSSLVIYSAGTYRFFASDGSYNPTVSATFTINPAATAQLVFASQPTTTGANLDVNPPVVVYEMDAFGNIIRTDNSNVTLSVESGPGAISGSNSVSLSNGAAVFDSISFATTGTYALIARDGALAAPISNSFQVVVSYKLIFASPPGTGSIQSPLNPPVVVYLMDSNGNIVRNNNSSVTLSVHSGLGAISGTTVVSLNNGAAIFSNVLFGVGGTYTITATDGNIVPITSGSFTILGPSKLVFAAPPGNEVAGTAYNPPVVVYVEDQQGNIFRNDNSAVTISVASGPGAVFGTASANLNNGAAVFSNLWLQTAGNYTLIAQDGALTPITSGPFVVIAAAASKLAFTTLPSTPTHGVAFTVKVSVEDLYGNVLTGQNTGTITLALATHPTGSALSGTLTANVVNGVATFSNLSVNLAGSYTFSATDNFAIGAATSSAIVVS